MNTEEEKDLELMAGSSAHWTEKLIRRTMTLDTMLNRQWAQAFFLSRSLNGKGLQRYEGLSK